MPKKLSVLATVLALVLSMATPALAQNSDELPAQDEVPACALEDACRNTSEDHQAAPEQYTVIPASDDIDQPFEAASEGASGNQYEQQTECSNCGERVAQAAHDAISGGDSDTGPSPTEAFGAALQAARDAGSSATGEAVASEEGQQDSTPVEETVAYQAAFEAAKEAGADEETAKETAKQAVADLFPDEAVAETVGSASGESSTGEASKTSKGGSSEGIAATEGKTSKGDASKDQSIKDRKDKPHEDDASDEDADENDADKEATEDTDKEIVASGEDGGSGDAPTTPADSKAPLLIGGVALLSVGGFTGFRMFARSWPLVRGRRLVRD